MNKLLTLFLLSLRYYKRFGYRGIYFCLRIYLSQNRTIVFSHPSYLNSINLRNGTSDIDTFYQVLYSQEYSIVYNFEPKVIVDCGANIGLAAIYFKNKFPDAKIISIEPEQSNFDLLLKNTQGYNNIHCLKNGIWNRTTNLFVEDANNGNWGFMVNEIDRGQQNAISAITITDIMKKFNLDQIDILKIDIEGSERELFESNFEEWLPKTKVLIIELHDWLRNGASKSFFKALCNYDFSITYKGDNIICFIK